jgi:hypothetical protein
MGQCPPLPSRILHTPCVGFSKTGTRYGSQVSGTGHRIRCSAFGSRPSVWIKNAGRSYLPCPSSLHGRGPNTEHRRPSPAPGKRAHRVCILHPGSPAPRPSPIALLPYCLIALLPYCPTALLPPRPPIGLTRPTGLAMIGVEASRDQVPRIGVKRERGANPLRSRRRDRGRKRRYATGSGHPVPPGKAARVGRSGSRKTCLVLLTGLLRGERP